MNKIDEAFELINLFHDNNYNAYLVGGSVRDLLMSREIKDIDITTDATPSQIINIAIKNNLKYIETGITHGTITIIYKDIPMEVTTFRVDKNCDGRHCVVEFVSSLEEDLSRRDFTINAMAIDKNYELIDLFEGQQDIENKMIRTVGNPELRFDEDKLRALRAIRFATTLDFYIADKTFDEISKVNLDSISKERIRDELTKILLSHKRIMGIRLLDATGLLNQIIPEIETLKGILQSELHHPEKDVFVHTMLSVDSLYNKDEDKWDEDDDISLELVLSTLLHDIGKPLTRSFESETEIHFYEHEKVGSEITEVILKRLKFPTKTIEKVKWLVTNHMRIHVFNEMKKSKKVSLIENEYFPDLLKLAIADINGSYRLNETTEDFDVIYDIDKFVGDYNIEKENRFALRQKIVDGNDILNLGIEAGIEVGQILEKINNEIVEGNINTKEEALKFVRNQINIKHNNI